MARHGGGRYGIEGVFAWMCLFIPLQIFKVLKRNQLIAKQQERKARVYSENNPTVPCGTPYLTCPSCGNRNYDQHTRQKIVFADIGPEHFCSISCQKAWPQKQNDVKRVFVDELLEEAKRIAIENGHKPSFRKTSNNHIPYGGSCELCDSGLVIIPNPTEYERHIMGPMFEKYCQHKSISNHKLDR